MLKSVSAANRNQVDVNKSFDLLYILKSVVISYAISVVLLFFSALFATYQCLSDKGISVLVNIITAIGVLICGFLSGRNSSRGGIFSGATAGIIYTSLLCLIGNLISKTFVFGSNSITALVIGLICGAVGGIVGINMRSHHRR